MPKLVVQGFDGIQPRTSDTMLGQNQATLAENVKLYAGELRYWRGPVLEFSPANTPVSIYKVYRNASSQWLTFTADTDIVAGPIADTNEIRLYYTSTAFARPRKTNWSLATTGSAPYPVDYRNLGVVGPSGAPLVSEVSASGVHLAGTYVYVYTYVSLFGTVEEESEPSPASAPITLPDHHGTAISGFSTAGTTANKNNITALRIYRSISDGSGNFNYAFVDQIPVTASTGVVQASGTSTNGVAYSSSTYVDTRTATQLGEALPTIGWDPPPDSLTGIVAMANGILAGFVGNTVYFCEPYFPHAWPARYTLTVPHNIVGLGSFGNTLVVCTDRFPYIIAGITPDGMSQERLPLQEPCVSKRSIVSDEYGVTYASPNGLVSIGPGSRGVSTYKLFRRDEWQRYNPSSLTSVVYDNKYVGAYTVSTLVPPTQLLVLQRDDVPALSSLVDVNQLQVTAMHVDQSNGRLYFVNSVDNKIYQLDVDDLKPTTYNWRSKLFSLPRGETFSCMTVDADYDALANNAAYQAEVAAIQAYNQSLFSGDQYARKAPFNTQTLNAYSLNGSTMLNYPREQTQRSIQAILYGDDGVVVASLTFSGSQPYRLNPFRTKEIQVLLSGNANVRGFALASTVQEINT